MQEAIPYKTWLSVRLDNNRNNNPNLNSINPLNRVSPFLGIGGSVDRGMGKEGNLKNMVTENAVIVFGRRGCCMSHVVRRLLQALGANPAVYEVDEKDEYSVVSELETMDGVDGRKDGQLQFPAVFIGGRLFGGLDRIMATHISGELTPILKDAGALWL